MHPSRPRRFLYEPKYGLPVVRETVDMGALLHDIRHERVSRIYWYTKTNVDVIDGPCLVIFVRVARHAPTNDENDALIINSKLAEHPIPGSDGSYRSFHG